MDAHYSKASLQIMNAVLRRSDEHPSDSRSEGTKRGVRLELGRMGAWAHLLFHSVTGIRVRTRARDQ